MMESAIHPLAALLIAILMLGLLTIFLYPEKGILARWKNNRKNTERILIEDEPQIIYSQLVALGLYKGMQLRVLDRTNEKLIIDADGNERILSPLFANHIHVETIRHKKEIQHHFATLTTLNEGEKASVVAVSRKIRGQQRRRLMDLGFVPGSEVTAMFKSAGNGLVAYQILGALIALRRSQTDGIFIHPVEDESHGS